MADGVLQRQAETLFRALAHAEALSGGQVGGLAHDLLLKLAGALRQLLAFGAVLLFHARALLGRGGFARRSAVRQVARRAGVDLLQLGDAALEAQQEGQQR